MSAFIYTSLAITVFFYAINTFNLISKLFRHDNAVYLFNNQYKIWMTKFLLLYSMIFCCTVLIITSVSDLDSPTKDKVFSVFYFIINLMFVTYNLTFIYNIFRAIWPTIYILDLRGIYYSICFSIYSVYILSYAAVIVLEFEDMSYENVILFGLVSCTCFHDYIAEVVYNSSKVSSFHKMNHIIDYRGFGNYYIFYLAFTMAKIIERERTEISGYFLLLAMLVLMIYAKESLNRYIIEVMFNNSFTKSEYELFKVLKKGKVPTSQMLNESDLTKELFQKYSLQNINLDQEAPETSEDEIKKVEEFLSVIFFKTDIWKSIYYKSSDHFGYPVHETSYIHFRERMIWERSWLKNLKSYLKRIYEKFRGYKQISIENENEIETQETQVEMKETEKNEIELED